MELCENITVNGWDFELVENDIDDVFYQCRGEVMYDDEHDEMPEPSLWRAAQKLVDILVKDGLRVYAGHSEKGWVEVTINMNNKQTKPKWFEGVWYETSEEVTNPFSGKGYTLTG